MKEFLNNWPRILNRYKNQIKQLRFPSIEGIYFLFKDKKLVYIGQTNNVYIRVADHFRQKGRFDKIYFLPINDQKTKIEWALIQHYQPSLNILGTIENNTSEEVIITKLKKAQKKTLFSKQLKSLTKQDLDYLTKRERDIIIYRYGLAGKSIKTLQELGSKYNITSERVRQITKKAYNKIRRRLYKPRKEI